MRAIILAAGLGTRLGKYTRKNPKCMINFEGETLIERQIRILRSSNINDITVVTGYQGQKIKIPGIEYRENKNYRNTNMVESLFCAKDKLRGNLIIAYSDILYEKKIIQQIIKDRSDIGVVVDKDYSAYWRARIGNLNNDMETLIIGPNGQIVELGKPCNDFLKARVRYVGIIKISNYGSEIFRKIYKKYELKKTDLTTFLQLIINCEYEVKPIFIRRGWLEFDTEKDLECYRKWVKDGTLSNFIEL